MEPQERIPIASEADVTVAQRRARMCAAQMGFPRRAQWEIATAISEAATNILKFAGCGEVLIRCHCEEEPCFEFEAIDRGRGIADYAEALQDGVSEGRVVSEQQSIRGRRGLGLGLGALHRLMDDASLSKAPSGGLSVRATKLLRPPRHRG